MDVILTHGAGLAGHQKTVMACRMTPDPTGQQAEGVLELRALGTMTVEVLALSDGLAEVGITQVAMERTGEYWRPVDNLLEGSCTVFLVNAAHVQQVPGRKTDKAVARWLAKLMRDGLWPASFIPPHGQRDWRDLTRDRTQVVQERSREANRGQGVLARANIKRASVATDIRGVSGRAILGALIEGRTAPTTMAEVATGRLRRKRPLVEQALTGLMRDHHRRLLALQWAHIDFLAEPSDTVHADITRSVLALGADAPPAPAIVGPRADGNESAADMSTGPLSCAKAVSVLDTIPGVDPHGAELLVAEWGTDMARFGTASRRSAWTGVAPGHDERAGKRHSGQTRRGHRALRTGLTQLAHAAARPTGTEMSALSHRIAARRGKKHAIIAVAHAIVVSAFHL